MALGEVVLADHLHDEGLPGGHVERVGESIAHGQDGHVPVLHVARPGQERQCKRLEHERGLGADDQAALGQSVGDGTGHEGKAQHRPELQRADQAELEWRVGQFQDQPGLGDALHPGPDQRDELAGDEQAKVAMVERAQAGGQSHGVVESP